MGLAKKISCCGLVLFTLFNALCYSQNRVMKKHKGTFCSIAFGGMNYSQLAGVDGAERRTYINDLVEDLRKKGADASGGIYPRIGGYCGLQSSFFYTNRFALTGEVSYSQKGYRENLYFHFSDTTYSSSIKLRADYLDFSLGIKYQSDYKISIYLGAMLGIIMHDKVKYRYEAKNDTLSIQQNETLYINQYYKVNRNLYLPGYVWGIMFDLKKNWGINLRVQKSANIFAETLEQKFLLFQIGIVYRYFDTSSANYHFQRD